MTNEEIVALITTEVEQFFCKDVSAWGMEDLENDTRELVTRVGQAIFQHQLERRVEASQRGYRGPRLEVGDGRVAHFERYEVRELRSYFGLVALERAYYWIPGDGRREQIAPLDGELGLNEHEATPALQKGLEALGVEVPFTRAERLLQELTRVQVSARTIAEVTEDAGGRLRAEKQPRVEEAWGVFEGPSCAKAKQGLGTVAGDLGKWSTVEGPARLYIQMDGGRVNTEEGWREPKVAVLFRQQDVAAVSKDRHELVRKEYVGTMEGIEQFMKHVWEAGLRWGAHQAKEIIVLGDGAECFQRRAEELYPEAVQILDWYHASEHLWEVARALYGAESAEAAKWAEPRIDKLRAGGVGEVLAELRQLRPRRREVAQKVAELIGYYESNRQRMKYDEFESKGYFIGSGSVESGVKNVVNMRMKGCGMKWNVDRADRMIHARAARLSTFEYPTKKLAA